MCVLNCVCVRDGLSCCCFLQSDLSVMWWSKTSYADLMVSPLSLPPSVPSVPPPSPHTDTGSERQNTKVHEAQRLLLLDITSQHSKHYNTASHSPIHAHIHSLTAVSTTQGDSQLVRSSQGEASRSGTPPHSARRSRGSN